MLRKSNVEFVQDEHIYLHGDNLLQGITGILNKVLFPDKYKGANEFYLNRAKEKGTYIHEMCELVDSIGIIPKDCAEVEAYIKLKAEHSLEVIANEYLVSDEDRIASCIDVVLSDYSLADIKTTASLDRDYVSWQLSFYAYLFELQNPELTVPHLYAIWLRGNKAQLVEVDRKPQQEVLKVIEAFFTGGVYEGLIRASKDVPAKVYQVESFIIELEEQIKEATARRDELKAGLLKMMEEANVKSWETDNLKITRVLASKSMTFDSKKFKEEQADMYAKYCKESKRAASIKITVR